MTFIPAIGSSIADFPSLGQDAQERQPRQASMPSYPVHPVQKFRLADSCLRSPISICGSQSLRPKRRSNAKVAKIPLRAFAAFAPSRLDFCHLLAATITSLTELQIECPLGTCPLPLVTFRTARAARSADIAYSENTYLMHKSLQSFDLVGLRYICILWLHCSRLSAYHTL